MKIVITGGGGFIGFKLAKALLARGTLAAERIARLTLVDQAFPADLPKDPRLATLAGDISDPEFAARAIAADTTSIFHLAAVVSGAAESDFDLGMRVNLGGIRCVLERARRIFDAAARPPRFVFASSVAAFGGELPEVLDDSTTPAPQTSYGSQKVIGEYAVSDYSRKAPPPRSQVRWSASRSTASPTNARSGPKPECGCFHRARWSRLSSWRTSFQPQLGVLTAW